MLIVQSEALLDAEHPSTLIAPMTTNRIDNAEPLRLHVKARPGLDQDSDLLLDQLRAIDNKRLIQGPLLQLSGEQMRAVNEALREVLGITET